MKIILTTVFVNDQDRALKFYTETLGFLKKSDVSAGEYRWLTVVSPEDPDGTELLLEPNNNPVTQAYQKGLFEQDIPAASFGVEDTRAEYERLKARGVKFTLEPTDVVDQVTIAVFNDTCGNLIQIQTMQG
ncbi:VOC family protein [Methanoculleus sp.]|uniref:VOC family protein n=1 Tax=Methanoculleus sp. TaxID=90427 RepID=UPI002FCB5B1C